MAREPRRPPGEPTSIALVGNAAEIEPAWAKAGERFDVVTDQTSAHDALAGYVPAEISLDDAALLRGPSRTNTSAASMRRDGRPRPGDARVPACRRGRLRLRQQPACPGPGGRRRRTRSTTRASCRPSSGRSSARAAARSAGSALSGDPADIAPDRRAILELFPDDAGLRRWIGMAQEQGPVPGPAGADLLARLRRAGEGRAGVQRAGPDRRGVGADRHRAGPPRLRARWRRRTARPRRCRRLRCDRRLAAAERAREHRRGRDVGVDPSRRRGRDRLQPARRDGRRRRRHGARGAEARARPHDGSRDGRPPPRRRGLRAGDRGRPRARRPDPDARRTPDGRPRATSSSTSGSARAGIVSIRRTGENRTGRNGRKPRIAEIQIVVRTPTISDSAAAEERPDRDGAPRRGTASSRSSGPGSARA